MKILLTDILTRKSFDVFNIIRKNFNVSDILLSDTSGSISLIPKTIYLKHVYRLRKDNIECFQNDLLSIQGNFLNEPIIYFPIEEDTTILFLEFIRLNGKLNFAYILPEIHTFRLSRDKYLLNKFCRENLISCPKVIDEANKEFLADNFFPLLVKPRTGSGARGFIHVDNKADLGRLEGMDWTKVIVQEKIKNGVNVKGAFFLCNKGIVISSYCHERIRTYPLSGGVTVYSQIVENNDILSIGSELLKRLEWDGFAMIEFLWDEEDKTYKVIEINPRLWGSILLSEFAGVYFLQNYIHLCLTQPLKSDSFNKGVKIRWFPLDLINWLKLKGKIMGFWKIERKKTCFINITYASIWSSFWFHFFFYLNIQNFQVLKEKWVK